MSIDLNAKEQLISAQPCCRNMGPDLLDGFPGYDKAVCVYDISRVFSKAAQGRGGGHNYSLGGVGSSIDWHPSHPLILCATTDSGNVVLIDTRVKNDSRHGIWAIDTEREVGTDTNSTFCIFSSAHSPLLQRPSTAMSSTGILTSSLATVMATWASWTRARGTCE